MGMGVKTATLVILCYYTNLTPLYLFLICILLRKPKVAFLNTTHTCSIKKSLEFLERCTLQKLCWNRLNILPLDIRKIPKIKIKSIDANYLIFVICSINYKHAKVNEI